MQNINKDLKSLHWGIIGCGDVTEIKSGPAFQQTMGFELLAVMRRDLDKAKDYASRHKVPKFYNNADALINDKEVDAVYIATPPDSHMEYALKVAEAGKPCCIEKPMALNYAECLQINSAFEDKGLDLFIAYYRRTLPRFVKVKQWIDSGEIGEVRHLNWVLSKPPSKLDLSVDYNWRTDIKVAPGGYFDDLASHGLDFFHFLFGTVRDAKGHYQNQLGLYTAPDTVVGSWIHETGITGTGSWNFGTYNDLDRVEIFGSKGRISFSIFRDASVILENTEGRRELFIEHPKHVQSEHIKAMRNHLFQKDFMHPSTGKSALHTSWIMDKILGKI